MSTTIRYTRPELLSLAPRAEDLTLSEEMLKKFSIIETECSAQPSSPDGGRHDTVFHKTLDTKNGGPAIGSKRITASNRFGQKTHGMCGSRDEEAFEEGYKYELEQNAIKKQTLHETMERERQKSDAAASVKEEAKKDGGEWEASSPSKFDSKADADDEIERLMVHIISGCEGGKKVTKSRFFSGANSGFQDANPLPPTTAQTVPGLQSTISLNKARDLWDVPTVVSASNNVVWNKMDVPKPAATDVGLEHKDTSSNIGGSALLMSGLSLGAPSNTGTVRMGSTSGTAVPQVAAAHPVATGSAPALAHASAPASAPTLASVIATKSRAPATQSTEAPASSQPRTWNAHDLEQRLISEQKVDKQQELPGKPIEATALEEQLLKRVQQSMGRAQAPTQPTAAVMPQMATGVIPVAGTPPMLSISGHMTPPQMATTQLSPHIPQQQGPQQQAVQMPWGMAVQKVTPQQIQQKLTQAPPQPQHRPAGMPQSVPIIVSGAQGGPYYAQTAMRGHYLTGFVSGQGQQQMLLYRPADGTAPYAFGTAGFPAGAQVLFSQQQQPAKQPNQRR